MIFTRGLLCYPITGLVLYQGFDGQTNFLTLKIQEVVLVEKNKIGCYKGLGPDEHK